MDVALIAAGALELAAAAIHGAGGERLVVRRLEVERLPSTRFGGPRMTMAMIHVSWHIVTVAFLVTGTALLVGGLALDGDAARALSISAAVAASGYGLVALGLGVRHMRSPRSLLGHPGPIVLTATAALAWVGAL